MPADKLSEGPGSKEQQRKQGTLGSALNVGSGLTGVSGSPASQTTEDRVTPSGEGGKTGVASHAQKKALGGPGKIENTDKPY